MRKQVGKLAGLSLSLLTGGAAANTVLGGATSGANKVIAIGADSPDCPSSVDSTAFGGILVGCSEIKITDPTSYQMGNGYNGGVVIGTASLSTGANTVALGHDTMAHGDNAIVIGAGAQSGVAGSSISNPLAIGRVAIATGQDAIALGMQSNASGARSIAMGSGAQASGNSSIAQGVGAVASLDGAIALGETASAIAGSAIAIGRISSATATNATAVGVGAQAAIHATAMGASANANASNTTAIGAAANATGVRASAMGTYANAGGQDALAAGYLATSSADGATALGTRASASGVQSVAIGAGSQTTHDASVALGANAATGVGARSGYVAYALAAPQTSVGEVSIGTAGAERQITNVAAGAAPTDAVNVSQLNQIAQNTAESLGGGASYDASTGTYTGPVYHIGGQSYNTVGDALMAYGTTINRLDQGILGLVEQQHESAPITVGAQTGGTTINVAGTEGDRRITGVADGTAPNDAATVGQLNSATQGMKGRIDKVENRANAGIATAMAMASLPQAYLPSKSMLSLGGATWNGESGYAVGLSTVSDNGSWVLKLSGGTSSRGDYGGAVGVGYQW